MLQLCSFTSPSVSLSKNVDNRMITLETRSPKYPNGYNNPDVVARSLLLISFIPNKQQAVYSSSALHAFSS